MFDPKELSYPRVEEGVILYGPEDWPPAKIAARESEGPFADLVEVADRVSGVSLRQLQAAGAYA